MKQKLNENRMGKRTFWFVVVVAVFIMAVVCTPAVASEPDEDGWEFAFTPYLWALSLDGSATVKGHKSDVDMSFSDIVSEMNIAFMFDFEARKDRLGFFVNPLYAVLSGDQTASGVSTDVTANIFVGSFGVDYQLGPYALTESSAGGAPAVTLVPFVGGRYTYLGVTINQKDVRYTDGSQNWLDPIVGLRTIWDFSKQWNFTLSGNIGGFGVGSDFAWEGYGYFGYRFSLLGKDNAQFLFGYRALYQDYKKGSGSGLFEFDATMHGPIVGLSIGF
ncbi:MAG: hypothetical protein MUO52_00260 [Desulfobacterales bacterium]|nr:hypothetical protein [Desulfobacterales bacterium]